MSAHQKTRLHKPNWAHSDRPPNAWAQFRHAWREEFAYVACIRVIVVDQANEIGTRSEFWGTFVILLFGAGVECQVRLNYHTSDVKGNAGDFLQCRLAWAAGVALAVWMAGGVSGGHCNPTVTIALTVFRGFPLRKVPGFITAQVAGATLASLAVYLNYVTSISAYEGGSDVRLSWDHTRRPDCSSLFQQPISCKLMLYILKHWLLLSWSPLFLLSPRRATWRWLWALWVGAIAGGILGASVYDAFLYIGRDSPFNVPSTDM